MIRLMLMIYITSCLTVPYTKDDASTEEKTD